MRALIEIIKEDPVEAIGGIAAWSGLGFIIFMLSIIGG